MTFMDLTSNEEAFLQNNKDKLRGIYKKRIGGIMSEILEMERGDERSAKLDILKALKDEYRAMGFFAQPEREEPEDFI